MSGPENPYAFPRHPDHPMSTEYQRAEGGMTLRDWFAGQALAALLNGQKWEAQKLANEAYRAADAMLAERSKS